MTTAEQARDIAMANALRAARVAEWKVGAKRWILQILDEGELFTADDLVEAVGLVDPSEGNGNNVVGAFIAAQARRGRIEWTGTFRKSERVQGHGNLQRVWRRVALGEATADAPVVASPSGGLSQPDNVGEPLGLSEMPNVKSRTSSGYESPPSPEAGALERSPSGMVAPCGAPASEDGRLAGQLDLFRHGASTR